jgi:hypothetical protein
MNDRAWMMFILGILLIMGGIVGCMYSVTQPTETTYRNPNGYETTYPYQYFGVAFIITGLIIIGFDYLYVKKSEELSA